MMQSPRMGLTGVDPIRVSSGERFETLLVGRPFMDLQIR
jgi:hypothetical protein